MLWYTASFLKRAAAKWTLYDRERPNGTSVPIFCQSRLEATKYKQNKNRKKKHM